MVAPLRKKNTLEQTGFQLVPGGFTHSGRTWRTEDIIETRRMRQAGASSDGEGLDVIAISFQMKSGDLLKVYETPTWTSDSQQYRVAKIESMFAELSRDSFNARLARYVQQLEEHGYFDYNGWRFFPSRTSLKDVNSGRTYPLKDYSLSFDGLNVILNEKHPSLGAKLLKSFATAMTGKVTGFTTMIDPDVIFGLLHGREGVRAPRRPYPDALGLAQQASGRTARNDLGLARFARILELLGKQRRVVANASGVAGHGVPDDRGNK